METKYYVIHEDLEDDEGDMVWSEKSYPRIEASEKADALGEKYPNAYVDIVSENNIHESFLDSQRTWTPVSSFQSALWDRYSIYVMHTDDPFKTFSDWLNS